MSSVMGYSMEYAHDCLAHDMYAQRCKVTSDNEGCVFMHSHLSCPQAVVREEALEVVLRPCPQSREVYNKHFPRQMLLTNAQNSSPKVNSHLQGHTSYVNQSWPYHGGYPMTCPRVTHIHFAVSSDSVSCT